MTINVGMNEIGACLVKDGTEVLATNGVSTCICILLKGYIKDTPFILMHHWPGFVRHHRGIEPHQEIISLADFHALKIESLIEEATGDFTKPTITDIHIYGGQHAHSQDGELLLSGTESEMQHLDENYRTALGYCCDLSEECQYHFSPFMTEGDDSIDITFDASGVVDMTIYHPYDNVSAFRP